MADISDNPWSWSSTVGSNQPQGSTNVGTGLDDNLRAIQAGFRSTLENLGSVAGTNTITAAYPVVIVAYVAGQRFKFIPANTNTGATTINVSSIGAKDIYLNGAALVGGELRQNVPAEISYDGTRFHIVGNSAFSVTPAGAVMDYAGSTAPGGWLECDGSAVSRTTYAALFAAISTTWGIGDNSTTFNLPDFRGKARIGKGTGTVTESVTNAAITTGTDAIAVTSNTNKWTTGMQVAWTVSGTPPTTNPANLLDNADTVFVIRVDATSIKLATTLANAQNGTAIDITNAGSGTFTMTHTYTARSLGEYGGEETHAMSLTELLAHTHALNQGTDGFNPGGTNAKTGNQSGDVSQSRGGNAAMNIMGPFAVTMAIIKT